MNIEIPAPGKWVVDPQRSSINFTARHLFGLAGVSGSFELLSGELVVTDPPTGSIVRATANAQSFSSGNPSRDAKVRSSSFLHVEEHPAIGFESLVVEKRHDTWILVGNITARPRTAPVEFAVSSASVSGNTLVVRATGTVDRYAHGITAMKGMAGRHVELELSVHAERVSGAVPRSAAVSHGNSHRKEETSMTDLAKIAVVYYSSTGTVFELAQSVVAGAKDAGAEVKLLKVAELASEEAIASNQGWADHVKATQDVPVATSDDILWADAVIFGSPTRFGNVASQIKQFIDSLGGLWARGLLANKVYSGFTATATAHGGQESTLLALYNTVYHFGGFVVPPGYTDPVKFVDGNPYGTSHVNGNGTIPVDDTARDAAMFQGKRVATITGALKAGLADGPLGSGLGAKLSA
ncbi:NAD(P)H:quinone oxidoreductase [Saccharopolyspora sp. 5N708]|uniref:NAD(P)H:quinone oxidoreductase n=1 Tax=Saccharopolyspora sp. 5N708 TaxID=3457424 RepID=UPI003FD1008B